MTIINGIQAVFRKGMSGFNVQKIEKKENNKIITHTLPANRINLVHSGTFWRIQGWGLLVLIFLSFFPTQFHHQEYLFFTLLILAIGISWIEGKTIWIRTPLDWPILLLVVWVLLTIPFAVDQAHSFTEWRKLAGRFLVFYWALLVFQRQPKEEFIYQVCFIVMIGALSISGYAIWDFYERGGTLVHRGVRAVAPSSHSHWLATYLVLTWPILLFLLVRAKSHWKRLLLTSILLFLSVAEFLAFSRGAWVAIAFQIIFLAYVNGGIRLKLISILGILLCALGLWWISQKGYLAGVFSMQSVGDRLGCWILGIGEIIAHPVLGSGFGNDTFSRIHPGDPPGVCGSGNSLTKGAHLHNTWLMFAMGSGIPAFIFLVWILVIGIKSLLDGLKLWMIDNSNGFRMAIALVLVGFWTCAFFDYLFTGSLAFLFLTLLASGISLRMKWGPPYQKNGTWKGA